MRLGYLVSSRIQQVIMQLAIATFLLPASSMSWVWRVFSWALAQEAREHRVTLELFSEWLCPCKPPRLKWRKEGFYKSRGYSDRTTTDGTQAWRKAAQPLPLAKRLRAGISSNRSEECLLDADRWSLSGAD
jgi:hypothetical protein